MHSKRYHTIQLPASSKDLDLLLFFIERDELDINDIPIAALIPSDDFLEYLHHLERMNIDMASEFILRLGHTCRIKRQIAFCPASNWMKVATKLTPAKNFN